MKEHNKEKKIKFEINRKPKINKKNHKNYQIHGLGRDFQNLKIKI